MKNRMRFLRGFIILTISILFFTHSASAYIDPGAGSYLTQIIIATLVTGLFIIRLFFSKIRIFFANLFSRKR